MESPASIHEERPLSPHLSIYRPQISSTLSILHRITGVALSAGAFVLALWIWAMAYGGPLAECMFGFFSGWFGQLLLIGWSAAFYYHLASGIRHLFWDMGKGYTLPVATKSGLMVLLFTFAATAGTWLYIYKVIGQ